MPIVEGMRWYHEHDFASFATPGHRLGQGVDPALIELFGRQAFELDMPVSGGATDVHFQYDVIREAEILGADAWGSDVCHYLVNGSSAGNLAYFLAHLSPGDRVIISRDLHKSLMTALIQTGVQPIYIAPKLHPELDFGIGIRPGSGRAGDSGQSGRETGRAGQPVIQRRRIRPAGNRGDRAPSRRAGLRR